MNDEHQAAVNKSREIFSQRQERLSFLFMDKRIRKTQCLKLALTLPHYTLTPSLHSHSLIKYCLYATFELQFHHWYRLGVKIPMDV